jgi:glutathione S-transferase
MFAIPAKAIERHRGNRDGRNHACTPLANRTHNGGENYWFALRDGDHADRDAANTPVGSHPGLAVKIAANCRGYQIISEGTAGLMQALDRFEPRKKFLFKLGGDGQISRAFGRNRRVSAIVANPAQFYFLTSGDTTRKAPMYQLHYFPANANAAPHMLLEEIGVRYGLVLVDRVNNAHKSKAYLKLNPNGRIPALVDENLIMSEAAAIVLHLVDQHPEAGLAPRVGTPERAKFYQWLTFLTNSLQEELMIWQYPERLAGEDAAARQVVKRGAEARASNFLDVVEDHLGANGPLFLGNNLSAADFYLVMLCRWARPMTKPPRSRPNIAKLLDKVTALPSVRRAYEREGITEEIC